MEPAAAILLGGAGLVLLAGSMAGATALYRWIARLDEPVPPVAGELRSLGNSPSDAGPVRAAVFEAGLYFGVLAFAAVIHLVVVAGLGFDGLPPGVVAGLALSAATLGAFAGERDHYAAGDGGVDWHRVLGQIAVLALVWQAFALAAGWSLGLAGLGANPPWFDRLTLTAPGLVLGTAVAVGFRVVRERAASPGWEGRDEALAGLAVVALGAPFAAPLGVDVAGALAGHEVAGLVRHGVSAGVVVVLLGGARALAPDAD